MATAAATANIASSAARVRRQPSRSLMNSPSSLGCGARVHTPLPTRVRAGGLRRLCVFFTQLSADPAGVGMTHVVEDGHGSVPRVPGRVGVTGGVAGVAEPIEAGRLLMPVAEVAVQVDGPLVAGAGLLGLAPPLADGADAVPGVGLTLPVAQLLVQAQGPLAGVQRLDRKSVV